MTVKTTLGLTDRHHRFLTEKVSAGVFASQSALVAAALEQMIQDEEDREVALGAFADETRSRLQTSREAFLDADEAFARARSRLTPGGR